MTLYLIGDSHVRSISVAFGKAPENFGTPADGFAIGQFLRHPDALKPFYEETSSEVSLNERDLQERLHAITGLSSFRADDENCYLLCMPYTTTVWLRFQQWRTFKPWRTSRNYREISLSDKVVEEMALSHFEYLIGFVRALHNLDLNVAIVEAPPPRSDDRAGGLGAETLLEIDRLARDAITVALQGVPVVRPPLSAYDPVGFLEPHFRKLKKDDRHHANYEYGALMLREILSRSRDIFPFLDWNPDSSEVSDALQS